MQYHIWIQYIQQYNTILYEYKQYEYKFCYMNVVKNTPMCHACGSKGSQPHNIQAYRLVLK